MRIRGVSIALAMVLVGCVWIGQARGDELERKFSETFDGAPDAPQPWAAANWDTQIHVRDSWRWEAPATTEAQHGPSCSGPPDHHHVESWAGAVFQCRDHVMTVMPGHGYGLIYLTPNQLVDFSDGPAIVQWDMSTEDLNQRDWPSVTISPWEYNQAVALVAGVAQGTDLQGPPRYALEASFVTGEGSAVISIVRDGEVEEWVGDGQIGTNVRLETNQAATRQTFRLTFSRDHVRFERLASETGAGVVYTDRPIADIGFDTGVVQFGHHAYDPEKNAGVQTWHWDNIMIEPAAPFSMMTLSPRAIDTTDEAGTLITLENPAPADSYLRFAAVGTPSISVDGEPFVTATRQWERDDIPHHASSYWHPIPEGTRTISVRMDARGWYEGPFVARDSAVWSLQAPAGSPTAEPSASPSAAATTAPTPATSVPAPPDSGDPDTGSTLEWWAIASAVGVVGSMGLGLAYLGWRRYARIK